MGRERVARQAEGTDPEFAANVNLAVRVEHGAAGGLAGYGLVEHRGEVLPDLERGVEGRDGHDGARRLDPRRRPYVPR